MSEDHPASGMLDSLCLLSRTKNQDLLRAVLALPFSPSLPLSACLGNCNGRVSFLTFLCCFSSLTAQALALSHFPSFQKLPLHAFLLSFELDGSSIGSRACWVPRAVPTGAGAGIVAGSLSFLELGLELGDWQEPGFDGALQGEAEFASSLSRASCLAGGLGTPQQG